MARRTGRARRSLSGLARAIAPLLVLALQVGPTAAEETTGSIIVTVTGLQSEVGQVHAVLFGSRETYLKNPVAVQSTKPGIPAATLEFDDVPHGEYALAVYHDVNDNGKLDRHFYGKPKEPGGFSNDARRRFGPAKWADARFELNGVDLRLQISLE